MSFFKHKKLLLVGMLMTIVVICVVVFVLFKTLFYFESEKYGKLLTQDIIGTFSVKWTDTIHFTDKIPEIKKKYLVHDFDYFPRYFVPLENIQNAKDNIICDAMTDMHSFSSFTANVRCYFGKQYIHYHFRKNYDHVYLLILLVGIALFGIYRMIRFIFYVESLKEQNLNKTLELAKEKVILEVGAKLVHDLKKGAMAQINNLQQEFGSDLDEEMIQPDFKERFKAKLGQHFEHIGFLNKYMSLLMVNLKRQKEGNWIFLDLEKLKQYLKTVFSISSFTEQEISHDSGKVEFIFEPNNLVGHLNYSNHFSSFWVPEMSFFRILKNISENYNAYGEGNFSFEFVTEHEKNQVVIKAKNAIRKKTEKDDSTQLGLVIIKQLILDNFGKESKIKVEKTEKEYRLTLIFPFFSESESLNYGKEATLT
jgi:hypothetical protein